MKRKMKGGGCGCGSSGVLGFPQAGGQSMGVPTNSVGIPKMSANSVSNMMPGNSMIGGPSVNYATPGNSMGSMGVSNGSVGIPRMPAQQRQMLNSSPINVVSENAPMRPMRSRRRGMKSMGSRRRRSMNQGAMMNQGQMMQQQEDPQINPPLDWQKLLFGGAQNGGFLGFGSTPTNSIPTNPASRLDNLEQRVQKLEKGGSSSFFGGRRTKTIKNKKNRR